jgi:hypothetical protein
MVVVKGDMMIATDISGGGNKLIQNFGWETPQKFVYRDRKMLLKCRSGNRS